MLIVFVLIVIAVAISTIIKRSKQAKAEGAHTLAQYSNSLDRQAAEKQRQEWIRKHPRRAMKRGFTAQQVADAKAQRFSL